MSKARPYPGLIKSRLCVENLSEEDVHNIKKIEERIKSLDNQENQDITQLFTRAVNAAKVCVKKMSKKAQLAALITTLRVFYELLSKRGTLPLKYPSQADFLKSYPIFNDRCPTELQKLHDTANWMHMLFKVINAKNNKGLALNVVSKFTGRISLFQPYLHS